MQWVLRDAEALCVRLFNRLPGAPQVARFNLAAPFANTVIVPAPPAGRVAFIDRLIFSVQNTGTIYFDDGAGAAIYGAAGNEASMLGGVEHNFERCLWAPTAAQSIRATSTSAGTIFNGLVIFRYA